MFHTIVVTLMIATTAFFVLRGKGSRADGNSDTSSATSDDCSGETASDSSDSGGCDGGE